MAGTEVIALASRLDAGLHIDVALSLFDVPAFGPDIRAPVPRIVRALVYKARARRGDDHFSFGRRSHADFHLDTARLRHTSDGDDAKAQCHCTNCASNPHNVSLIVWQIPAGPRLQGRGHMNRPRRVPASFDMPAVGAEKKTSSDRRIRDRPTSRRPWFPGRCGVVLLPTGAPGHRFRAERKIA